jgi:hypothetical protein
MIISLTRFNKFPFVAAAVTGGRFNAKHILLPLTTAAATTSSGK